MKQAPDKQWEIHYSELARERTFGGGEGVVFRDTVLHL
jgi:hypothetical protein